MSDAVWVALITVVVGGIFTALYKIIDAKASNAKDEVNRNTAEVEAVNKALEGMQLLANNLRLELDRKDRRIETLEKDLIEEKSINVALSKDNDKLRKEKS